MTVHRPQSLADALAVAADHPDAHLLSGGTDTMVEVNFSKFKPGNVIALRQIAELRSVSVGSDAVRIGAGLPYKFMETGELAGIFPALAQAARTVGSPQIRAAGTLGGNLGTCSPAGDGLPVLAALSSAAPRVKCWPSAISSAVSCMLPPMVGRGAAAISLPGPGPVSVPRYSILKVCTVSAVALSSA